MKAANNLTHTYKTSLLADLTSGHFGFAFFTQPVEERLHRLLNGRNGSKIKFIGENFASKY